MKWINYKMLQGITEAGDAVLLPKSMRWSEENEAAAAAEAHNGEYTIEDDGMPNSAEEATDAQRITELEATLNALLGVNE